MLPLFGVSEHRRKQSTHSLFPTTFVISRTPKLPVAKAIIRIAVQLTFACRLSGAALSDSTEGGSAQRERTQTLLEVGSGLRRDGKERAQRQDTNAVRRMRARGTTQGEKAVSGRRSIASRTTAKAAGAIAALTRRERRAATAKAQHPRCHARLVSGSQPSTPKQDEASCAGLRPEAVLVYCEHIHRAQSASREAGASVVSQDVQIAHPATGARLPRNKPAQ